MLDASSEETNLQLWLVTGRSSAVPPRFGRTGWPCSSSASILAGCLRSAEARAVELLYKDSYDPDISIYFFPSEASKMNCTRCQMANPEGAKFCLNCGNQLEAQVRVEGERKYVTVLFADVVDSTGLGERLDPEQVAEIMNGAFAFLNASVKKYDGTIARLLGDAILAFFGAPVAHEDDAERAVRAGLDIQAAAREYAEEVRRNYGVDFKVRVGINTGLAVLAAVGDEIRTEYTAMGDTTNVAARLQSAAEAGTVLISADTYHLVKQLFEFKPRGATKIKGQSTPIETYEVLAPKTVQGRVRGLEDVTSPLVGRDAEVQVLREKLKGLLAGQGAVGAVVGEAGPGKSRLIAEVRKLVNTAPQRQVVWLEGRTIPVEPLHSSRGGRRIRGRLGRRRPRPRPVVSLLTAQRACARMHVCYLSCLSSGLR